MPKFLTTQRSATVRPRLPAAVLFLPRVSVNPSCVASNLLAEVMEGAIDKQEAAVARQQLRYRSRDEERPMPSPPIRRRQRDAKRTSSSSSRLSSATRSADAHRRDRDDAYRTAKKKQDSDERDRACRNDMTRKSVSGASRTRPHGAGVHDNRKPTPEKLETAEYDEAEVARRRDIQRQREEARREMDKMVKTAEFNGPFISPLHVLKPRTH
jgi:hypothetical protein